MDFLALVMGIVRLNRRVSGESLGFVCFVRNNESAEKIFCVPDFWFCVVGI
jgi:hypothetical protein